MEAIKVNLIPNGIPEACHASQYDEGRQIRLDLFDGLTPYTIQAGDTFTLNVRKPDNHVITQTVTGTAGNTYLVIETSEQMTAVTGENLCEIRVENDGDNIGSLNFIMQVEKDVIANGIPSESVIEDLEALVVEAVGDNYYTKSETDALLAQKADESELLNILPTDTASGAIANFTDGADNIPVKALSAEFSASQASGTPTPSTPIPIVGVDKVNFTRTGKNLFNPNTAVSGYIATDGNIASASTTNKEKTSDYVAVKDTSKYLTLSLDYGTTQEGWGGFGWYDADKNFISRNATTQSSVTKLSISRKPPENAKYFRATLRTYGNTDIQVEITETTTATEYEPYNGTTALINLGGTYYGGSVDAVTGKITENYGKIVFDGTQSNSEFAFTTQDGKNRITWIPFQTLGKVGSNAFKSDKLATASGYASLPDEWTVANSAATVARCFIGVPSTITSVADWQAYVTSNPITLVYELATPIVVYASNAIELNTLYGVNNFFSDAGDVDVTIRADIALYIQKLLGGNANRSLGANPSILRTGAISTDIEVREPDSEPVELEDEVIEQPENEDNDNEER